MIIRLFCKVLVIILIVVRLGRGEMEGKVVGGEYVDIMHYPHSVFLEIFSNDELETCGSSTLTQQLLLTAAHCVEDCNEDSKIFALAGHHVIEKMTVIRRVLTFLMHEMYNRISVEADIALLWLDKSMPLGMTIQRVIVMDSFPANFTPAVVAGWGIIDDYGTDTEKLKKVDQRLMPSDFCSGKRLEGQFKNGMMCAMSLNSEEYPSQGDSGSALVTNMWQQIGIVSYKTAGMKDVIFYSNVSFFYPWIVRKSRAMACAQKRVQRSNDLT